MKYIVIAWCCLGLLACEKGNKYQASDLKGNWKIYQMSYGGKDISKSGDPTNENGFWFDGTKDYRRFGNEAHQDTGTYQVQGEWLIFNTQQDSATAKAIITLKEDTLKLVLPIQDTDTIKMSLYKMAE